MLRLSLVNGLLTRIQTNAFWKPTGVSTDEQEKIRASQPADLPHIGGSWDHVQVVYVYNHGFPDSSVAVPLEVLPSDLATPQETLVPSGAAAVETVILEEELDTISPSKCDRYFASRVPRKLCESLLSLPRDVLGRPTSSTDSPVIPGAFLCFNTNGMLGSYGTFQDKSLLKDMADVHTVVSFAAKMFRNAALILIGLSTGAFLSVAYASGEIDLSSLVHHEYSSCPDANSITASRLASVRPSPNLKGVVAIACVDDIPMSYSLDFNAGQLEEFNTIGYCTQEKFDLGYRQVCHLGKQYLESYKQFPQCDAVVRGVNVPVLLVHGSNDSCVPVAMAQRLIRLSAEAREHNIKCPTWELCEISGANHLLSNSKHMSKASQAVCEFSLRQSYVRQTVPLPH
eukprot:GHVQ01038485.1.p1 GENE.GHVQ01038485.1~~GHVQ01038485.1.p1  ORF type:complete len:399 (-),score=40.34 GHVQ01038485.1:704-1900(-)